MSESREEVQAKIGVQRVYVKDISFESPGAPDIFLKPFKPAVNMDLSTEAKNLEAGTYEVSLNLTVTAKEEDKTVFIAEIQQAGIFSIEGVENKNFINQILGSYCPNLLYPYARELIDSLTTRGSFPPLNLAPVNFEQLMAQKQQQQANPPAK